MHTPLVDLNPLPILRQGKCVLDDNVNLMWQALDAQHWKLGGLFEASHNATMAFGHCGFAISQPRHELGILDCHRTA